MLAAEKYASELKDGTFSMDEAEGVRRRAEEAQKSQSEALRLLNELEAEIGN